MPSTPEPKGATTNVQRVNPKVNLPTADVLRRFSIAERAILERVTTETAECVYNPIFDSDTAEAFLLGPPPSSASNGGRRALSSDDSGVDLLLAPDGESLEIDEERHLFLRLNFARYRVLQAVRAAHGKRLGEAAARELVRWEQLVADTRNELVRANVPLVLAMVKRTRINAVDYADLISEGNLALMRTVDKFDCSRGYKFSTYACRAILKSFARVASRTARYRSHFPTEFDPTLEKSDHLDRKRVGVENDCVDELRSVLGENSARLSDVEATVIQARFAIGATNGVSDAKTLEQVGEMIGVTKERVRQIQNKALVKLRSVLDQGVLAV